MAEVESTIVEIIEAYQPVVCVWVVYHSSTIVEIIEAYQPLVAHSRFEVYLQQQKLLKLTSLDLLTCQRDNIYNSRNY